MHLVTLTALKLNRPMTVEIAITDAKNRESAGRLATYYAFDNGYDEIKVTDSRRVTSGYVIVDEKGQE